MFFFLKSDSVSYSEKKPLRLIRDKCDNFYVKHAMTNRPFIFWTINCCSVFFYLVFGIFLGLIVTGEACLILCVYLSINSRHLTAQIGSEQPGEGQPGLGRRWPAADFCPMSAQYCDRGDQSGPSWHWATLSRPRIIQSILISANISHILSCTTEMCFESPTYRFYS